MNMNETIAYVSAKVLLPEILQGRGLEILQYVCHNCADADPSTKPMWEAVLQTVCAELTPEQATA